MDKHFARGGPEGRTMMCSTASVQVCLDAGVDDADVADRWHALHAWLPVLTALFANSPAAGWRSGRTAVWAAIDPTRTVAPAGTDPRAAYGKWALDAQLLAVRREDGSSWSAPPGVTFRDWLRGGAPRLGAPSWADLDYHLTTLFPPVRPRGYLEVRYLDQQPAREWPAPVAVLAALLADDESIDSVRDLCAGVEGRWEPAARFGLTDPELAVAAKAVAELAGQQLPATGLPRAVCDEINELVGRRLG
jgi:glutamate--cysteine ligase